MPIVITANYRRDAGCRKQTLNDRLFGRTTLSCSNTVEMNIFIRFSDN